MKRLRLQVAEDAAREIREAQEWWHANRRDARGAFKEDLRRALDLIRTQPGVGVRAANVRSPDVRRMHLGRLRYDLYYRVTPDRQTVMVLAFWHSSRGTSPNI